MRYKTGRSKETRRASRAGLVPAGRVSRPRAWGSAGLLRHLQGKCLPPPGLSRTPTFSSHHRPYGISRQNGVGDAAGTRVHSNARPMAFGMRSLVLLAGRWGDAGLVRTLGPRTPFDH